MFLVRRTCSKGKEDTPVFADRYCLLQQLDVVSHELLEGLLLANTLYNFCHLGSLFIHGTRHSQQHKLSITFELTEKLKHHKR